MSPPNPLQRGIAAALFGLITLYNGSMAANCPPLGEGWEGDLKEEWI